MVFNYTVNELRKERVGGRGGGGKDILIAAVTVFIFK